MDATVDIHGRSHSFLLIHPKEVFLAWCWVIARPLFSCGVVLLSLPPGVGLTGVELVYLSCTWWTPTYRGMPASDVMRRSQLQCRMWECLCWSFTSYEGTSVMIWHTTSWGLSSHLSLSSSSFEKCPPWLGWDYQVSTLSHLFSNCSTISVFEPLP